MKSKYILRVFVVLLLTPLWMRIIWQFIPTRQVSVIIIDKTVKDDTHAKHRSLNWILNLRKYVKRDGSSYEIDKDYFGFFPGEDEQYLIKDFDNMSDAEVDSIAGENDMCYFTDTYGVWSDEWYRRKSRLEKSINIYGGLSEKDVLLMLKMKAQKKLVIAEFNILGVPTPTTVKNRFEELFGLKSSGWIGRYITTLDTTNNPDLPQWIVSAYKQQNNGDWKFRKEGMILVNDTGKVIILEAEAELSEAIPDLYTNASSAKRYNLPEQIIYPYWMEIVSTYSPESKVISEFTINTNNAGDAILKANNIPKRFPAIISHDAEYRFYYFAGDFADNPTKFRFSKLWGMRPLRFLMYNAIDKTDRNRFFWEFYQPLMEKILEEQHEKNKVKT